MKQSQIYVPKKRMSDRKPFLYGMLLGMVGVVGFLVGLFYITVLTGTKMDVTYYYTNVPCKVVYTMGIKDNGHVGWTWNVRCE